MAQPTKSSLFSIRRLLQHRSLNNRRGVALIMAVTSLLILTYFAMEVTYDSAVEYTVNSQGLNRIKAYYAAKSAVQLGLLRVKIYQQLMNSPVGAAAGEMADEIWKMKIAWPIPVPEDLNAVDRDTLAKASKESKMDGSWDLEIVDEGSKIDLNDLASPSKTLRDLTRQQLLAIFQQAREQDENWARKNSNLRPEEIIDALTDWQTDKIASVNGGDKRAKFSNLGPEFPPNRAFRTLEEIRLVPGMTDEVFELLFPRITIFGMKAINPNTADEKVLKSLDPSITDKIVEELKKAREKKSFGGSAPGGAGGTAGSNEDQGCAKSFWDKAIELGANPTQDSQKTPMTCKSINTFRITGTGVFGQGKNAVQRQITVIVMNVGKTADRLKKYVEDEKKAAAGTNPSNPNPSGGTQPGGGTANPTTGNSSAKNNTLPKGPPRIVYWNEK